MTGEVIFYNPKLCFGFIKTNDGESYFVHRTGITPGTKLYRKTEVSFELKEHNGKYVAVNVAKVAKP